MFYGHRYFALRWHRGCVRASSMVGASLLLFGGVATSALASPGDLDPRFGDAGRLFPFGVSAADAAAVLPSGGALVVGNDDDFLGDWGTNLMLLAVDDSGHLRKDFGGEDRAYVDAGGFDDGAADVLVTQDGKWVIAGTTCCHPGGNNIAVYRVMPDGQLDATFGTAGVRIIDLGGDETGVAVAAATDGAIYVAADTALGSVGSGDSIGIAITRLLPTGATDARFGDAGLLVIDRSPESEHAVSLRIDTAGRIVLLESIGRSVLGEAGHCVLSRFDPDGRPDLTFGDAGAIVVAQPGAFDADCSDALLQPDGSVIVTGTVVGNESTSQWPQPWARRFRQDGSQDPSFGVDGTFEVTHPDCGRTLGRAATLPSGTIAIVGHETCQSSSKERGLVLALTPDGQADGRFGPEGIAYIETRDAMDRVHGLTDLAVMADGALLLIGYNERTSPYDVLPTVVLVAKLLGDAPVPPLVGLTSVVAYIDDPAERATVTVRRYGSAANPARVAYRITPTEWATSRGIVFDPVQGSLEWPAGDLSDRLIEMPYVGAPPVRAGVGAVGAFLFELSSPEGVELAQSSARISVLLHGSLNPPPTTNPPPVDPGTPGPTHRGGGRVDVALLSCLLILVLSIRRRWRGVVPAQ